MRRGSYSAAAAARLFFAALLTSVSAGALATQARAQAPGATTSTEQERLDFDIPAQPLSSALSEFARQSGVRTLFSYDRLSLVRTRAVHGEFTRQEALNLLLTETGYQARISSDNVMEVEAPARPQSPHNDAAESAPVRVPSSQSRRTRSEEFGTEEETIIVVGTNIRGIYPSSSPVQIYTAEDIARTGATTTEQFVQKLPQNLGTRTQYAGSSAGTGSAGPNREAVNGVDLRGLGVGTTLVLLNGRRMALSAWGQSADVSAIPVSAIDRVEVLTDGASAIYGSDAIGGVVNFVLRTDYDGAETRASYGGVTEGGLRQGRVSHLIGGNWNSGNAMLSLDTFSASALEAADRSYAAITAPGTLTPVDQRYNALGAFSQQLSTHVTLDGQFNYALRDTKNVAGFPSASRPSDARFIVNRTEADQFFGNFALSTDFGDTLHASLAATYTENDVDGHSVEHRVNGSLFNRFYDQNFLSVDVTTMLGGTAFLAPGGEARFSLGIGYLQESFQSNSTAVGFASGRELARGTTYGFGEFFIPIVSEENALPFVRRLDLSLSARYTKYQDKSDPALGRDFGDNTNPKIGILWSPVEGLNFRATYGESFRAPSLTEIDPSGAINYVVAYPVPLTGGVPSIELLVAGSSTDLEPETATSYTFGFDYEPLGRTGFRASATYFSIDYSGRIAIGDSSGGLGPLSNPDLYPDVIYRASSADQIERILRTTENLVNIPGINLSDPAAAAQVLYAMPNFWILDQRYRNLSGSMLDGVDLIIADEFATQLGAISIEAQLTRMFEYTQQVSASSPVISVVDTVLHPADLRGRISVGLTRDAFDATLGVNYVDDYSNPYATVASQNVGSWTTTDASLTYDFFRDSGAPFGGFALNLSIQNLLDQDPPSVALSSGEALRLPVGFDPANANPYGRLIVLGLTKRW
jgi:outer membrane receptor protein involved in Fe transport